MDSHDLQDNRPSVYWEGDKAVFRASSLGGCTKSLIALAMGMEPLPPMDWQQKIYDFGHEAEPYIVKAVSDMLDLPIEAGQPEVEIDVLNKATIRGHVDGDIIDPRTQQLISTLEAKTFGKTLMGVFENGGLDALFEAEPYLAWQGSVYFYARGELPLTYAIYDKRAGEPWDLSLDELKDAISIREMNEAPISKGRLLAKPLQVIKAAETGDLPVECDVRSAFCSVPYMHEDDDLEGADSLDDYEPVTVETQEKIASFAATYAKARAEAKRANAAKKEAGKKLKALLEEVGAESVDTGRFKVTEVSQTRSRTNKKALGDFLNEHGKTLDEFKDSYEITFTRVTDREDEV